MTPEFPTQVFDIAQVSICMKIRLVEAELFHSDRQTDIRDRAYSRFPQFFAEAPKSEGSSNIYSLYDCKRRISLLITFIRFAFITKNFVSTVLI
jgi:hypothetical protein